MEKKMQGTMFLIILFLMIISFVVLGLGCFKIKKFFAGRNAWLKKLDTLPVLKNDDEIAEALKGEPKDYLIENYVFTKGVTVHDTVLDCLKGEYLYISIVEETHIVKDAYIQRYRNEIWEAEPYENISGKLLFGYGIPLELPENVQFEFSLKDDSRLQKSDLKQDKQSKYFMARYYPDGVYKIDKKKMHEMLKENLGKNTQKYSSRYKFNFMEKGDNATFVARIGNNKAELSDFGERNIIAVRGNRRALAKYLNRMSLPDGLQDRYIMDYVILGFWILAMWISLSVGIMSAGFVISYLFGK